MAAAPGIEPRTILIALYIKHKGDLDKMYSDIQNKVNVDVQTYLAGIDPKDYVTILDKEYSDDMRYLPKPPLVIEKRKMRRW